MRRNGRAEFRRSSQRFLSMDYSYSFHDGNITDLINSRTLHNHHLDLRCGAKKSLADPPKQCLALKSCDISSTRPHLLLVGGSDTFARLYDRRMLPPLSSSQKKLPPPPCVNYFCPMHLSDLLDKCRKLIQIAEKSLKGETDYYYGIEACNEVLDGRSHEIGPTLMHECLCIRASLLLKRMWKSDAHMAIRDCQRARKINPSSTRALICMAEALSMLEKHKEALDFAIAAQSLAPSDPEITERVENIKKNLAAAGCEADFISLIKPESGSVLDFLQELDHTYCMSMRW
ncbi:UNVERIFIED_CONTAM: hypothetical protein Sindi_0339200 [Sesamum indicum]